MGLQVVHAMVLAESVVSASWKRMRCTFTAYSEEPEITPKTSVPSRRHQHFVDSWYVTVFSREELFALLLELPFR